MAVNKWNVGPLLIALVISSGIFSWGQFPQVPEASNSFPQNNLPAGVNPSLNSPSASLGPNYPQVAAAGNSELLVTTSLLADGRQQVVVTDTQARIMAIYEVEPTTGKVLLRSVREIRWDLQMQQFNATSPTPGEIRAMITPK